MTVELSMQYYDPVRDFGEVYRLFVDPETNAQILFKPDHNDVHGFEKWLNDSLHHSINDFMVFYSGKTFVGFAYSYEFRPLDGHCRFTLAVRPEFRAQGLGGLISVQFLRHLFVSYPLRKVYFYVYAYNTDSLACARALVEREECILREHHYHDGTYHDVHVFAISRQVYDQRLLKYWERREYE